MRIRTLLGLAGALVFSATTGCSGASIEGAGGAGGVVFFKDARDGHLYREVPIAGAVWMGENLAWESPAGLFCYDEVRANCDAGGRLYTFDAAESACPAGWHLSSDDEWKALETSLGMPAADLAVDGYSSTRGTDEGTKLKAGGSSGLDFPMTGFATTDYAGTTVTGFTGLTGADVRTYIWTSTLGGAGVFRRRLERADAHAYRFSNPEEGFAIVVRCVKDG